jgi:hypothetical protein
MASVGTIKYKNGSSWIDILHPVNSFYFSYASTSPSSLFGGTWTQVTNAALRGAKSTGYTGSDTTTLTTSQIPKHTHNSLPNTIYFWVTYRNGFPNGNGDTGWGLTNSNHTAFYWSGTNNSAGGGGSHTNIQRSFNCYIWYRTA